MNKSKYIFLFEITVNALIIFLSTNNYLHAQSSFSSYSTIGTFAGYSSIIGHYGDSLNNGHYAGLFSFFPVNDYIMITGNLWYNRFTLSHSSNSSMQVFGLSILPSVFFHVLDTYIVYTGIGVSLQHYTLSALKTDTSSSTTKTGFAAHTGLATTIFQRTCIAMECAYTLSELSHKYFQSLSFTIKAGYQFALYSPEYYVAKEKEQKEKREEHINQLFLQGVEYYTKKDAAQAIRTFNQVLSLQPHHKEALEHLKTLNNAQKQYDRAISLINQNKDFEALPLIASASLYIEQAENTLKQLQGKHKASIPELINKAIESFNNKNYDECIATMNIVLLIDPYNETAKAYSVRAQRIKETILKLQ